eukprot:gene32752-39592_t
MKMPRLPFQAPRFANEDVPPMWVSTTPHTWAHDTMTRRVIDDILPRIIEDNLEDLTNESSRLGSDCLSLLKELRVDIAKGSHGFLRSLEDGGPDKEDWDSLLSEIPDRHRNWLQAPWLVAEFYFYRRVVEAFRFFETKYDMFRQQKQAGLMESMSFTCQLAESLPMLLKEDEKSALLEVGLYTSLWGNKMDLSLWPSHGKNSCGDPQSNYGEEHSGGQISVGKSLKGLEAYILDNHMQEVVHYLLDEMADKANVRIDIVLDNAGYELVSDLFLVYLLLVLGVAGEVRLHTKAHPTFVSDATTADVLFTIDYLAGYSSNPEVVAFGGTLKRFVEEGKLVILDDLFWCQPRLFWDLPPALADSLSQSDLVILKGDANYRRAVGDCPWTHSVPAKDVLSYWPAPVCALRALKSEVACGISAEQEARAAQLDERWLVSGKWAVVQFRVPR